MAEGAAFSHKALFEGSQMRWDALPLRMQSREALRQRRVSRPWAIFVGDFNNAAGEQGVDGM